MFSRSAVDLDDVVGGERVDAADTSSRCVADFQTANAEANRRSREFECRLLLAWAGLGQKGGGDGAGVSGEDRDLDRVAGVVWEVGCESGVEVGVLRR
jgi:hypothetical protein